MRPFAYWSCWTTAHLRDLGLERSELLSAAAELHGLAEHERRQTLFGTLLPR